MEKNSAENILIPKIAPADNYNDSGLSSKSFFRKRSVKIVLGLVALFLIIVTVVASLFYNLYKQAASMAVRAKSISAAAAQNDLDLLRGEIEDTQKSFSSLKNSYRSVSWMSFLPFFGGFIKDGQHALLAGEAGLDATVLLIDTASPYADVLGFIKNADQAGSGIETAQDRIDFVIKTLPQLAPKADELAYKVEIVAENVLEIDENRYPEVLFGKPLRSQIKKVKELVSLGSGFVVKSKPLLEASGYILGADEEREYLVIFQNDKELRPTGGFITAYALAKVKDGRFEPVSSSDIYSLDDKYKPSIKAPDPIIDYLKGPYTVSENLRLRDMNWSADFSESMDLFGQEIKKAGINNIDGIIAVDTQLLVNLLNAIGPIGVSGFGNFSTEIVSECNCPQVIYELESFADVEGPVVWSQDEPGKIIFAPPNYENRKRIIGPLMNSILANALGQPKDKLPALFEASAKSLMEKHVLFYFFDDKAQRAVSEFGIAGIIDQGEGDYLHINDANLGGRKSNLYVTQEVFQEVSIAKNGSIEKTLTITYNNPAPYDGWLNSVLPNWVRIYVPKGSELIEFSGATQKEDPYEENGKSVFAGFFELRPLGVAKLVLKYKLPFKATDHYALFLQKQPGKDAPLYSFLVNGAKDEFFLRQDKRLKFKI